MDRSLPYFRYHPNPLETEAIRETSITCPVCGQYSNYAYVGGVYSRWFPLDTPGICPWCVKDGSAAAKYRGKLVESLFSERVDKREYVEELELRTPSFAAMQQETWLIHCGDFCAFLKYPTRYDLESVFEQVEEDVAAFSRQLGMSVQELMDSVPTDDGARVGAFDISAYLFQCLHCDRHRVYFDLA